MTRKNVSTHFERNISAIRNIGIMAHIDAGKTTLTERILYNTGRIHKVGEVHKGNAEMDWRALEKKHGITISAAATSCAWRNHQITILDTPGHVDFTIEVERSLRVLDGAVAIFSGVAGVEPQSETVWRQADKHGVPRICFINKMDNLGADFGRTVSMIAERLNAEPLVVQLPIGSETEFCGVLDLVTLTALRWPDGQSKPVRSEIPDGLVDRARLARANLVEQAASLDDKCLARYLEVGDEIPAEDLSGYIRTLCVSGLATPVLSGSAFRNIGVQPLLDAIVDWCPSPLDRPNVVGSHPESGLAQERFADNGAPLCALVSKVQVTAFGPLATIRIYSGALTKGQMILASGSGETFRVGRILRMHADQQTELPEAGAGDVVSLTGLKSVNAGETLCDPDAPILLGGLDAPDPVIEAAVEPKGSADQEKLAASLVMMAREDPSLKLSTDTETGQLLLSGMGELHLQICLEELQETHGVSAALGRPRVAYKEALTKPVTIDHTLRKQSGGPGQYARVKLEIEPADGDVLVFDDCITGGAVPAEFVPSVERGLSAAMSEGPLCGYPMSGLKVALVDGAFHPVDSSALAFERAASEAFRLAAVDGAPVILEPVMRVEVTTPEDHVGAIIGDLNGRRGRIVLTETSPSGHRIEAHVPLAEMFGYVGALRSLSSGRAVFSMVFDHYAKAPAETVKSS